MGLRSSRASWSSGVMAVALAAATLVGSAGVAHADEAPFSVHGSVKLPAGVSTDRILVNVLEPQLAPYPGTVSLDVARSTSLGPDGSYHFEGLEQPGQLGRQIEVVDSAGRLYARAWGGERTWGQPRKGVVAAAGSTLDLGQVEMIRTGSAQGRVVSSNPGESVAGAVVQASIFTCANKCYFIPVVTDLVSADGSFYLDGLPGGTSVDPAKYQVTITDPDGRFEEYSIGKHTAFLTVTDAATKDLGRITLTSTSTGPAPAPAPAKVITMTKAPSMSGKVGVWRSLRASKGTWGSSVRSKVSVRVQWQTKKGAKVSTLKGASSHLFLTPKYKGRTVRLKVTATAPGHPDVVHTTPWSKKVT